MDSNTNQSRIRIVFKNLYKGSFEIEISFSFATLFPLVKKSEISKVIEKA